MGFPGTCRGVLAGPGFDPFRVLSCSGVPGDRCVANKRERGSTKPLLGYRFLITMSAPDIPIAASAINPGRGTCVPVGGASVATPGVMVSGGTSVMVSTGDGVTAGAGANMTM